MSISTEDLLEPENEMLVLILRGQPLIGSRKRASLRSRLLDATVGLSQLVNISLAVQRY